MLESLKRLLAYQLRAVEALGDVPLFARGDRVRISIRYPVGRYGVPCYVRGKQATVEAIVHPVRADNEEDSFGRSSGTEGIYYRIVVPLVELYPGYRGSPRDSLRIEVCETWLEESSCAA
jgi:hypothetical protein